MKLSHTIKSLCRKAGVKSKVKSLRSSVYVTFLSAPTQELVDAIRALETVEAHGDLMDDTRWYSGTSIHFRYQWEPTDADKAQYRSIMDQYAALDYHFVQRIKEEMGARGFNILDRNTLTSREVL